jgi:hypothetical protein
MLIVLVAAIDNVPTDRKVPGAITPSVSDDPAFSVRSARVLVSRLAEPARTMTSPATAPATHASNDASSVAVQVAADAGRDSAHVKATADADENRVFRKFIEQFPRIAGL